MTEECLRRWTYLEGASKDELPPLVPEVWHPEYQTIVCETEDKIGMFGIACRRAADQAPAGVRSRR